MVQFSICFAAEDPVDHGSVIAGNGQGRINVIIYGISGPVALEGAEGQAVVPGNHGKLTLILVKVIIVDHGAGIAVCVCHEVMNHKVADHGFDIHSTCVAFA